VGEQTLHLERIDDQHGYRETPKEELYRAFHYRAKASEEVLDSGTECCANKASAMLFASDCEDVKDVFFAGVEVLVLSFGLCLGLEVPFASRVRDWLTGLLSRLKPLVNDVLDRAITNCRVNED
jgi:hypothetical protein